MSPRAPFRSRPDPRAEEDTPIPEAPATLAIVRDEQRDLRARIAALEEMVDAHEDALSTTKVRALTEESKRQKWGDRAWDLGKSVLAALIIAGLLYASGRLTCTAPPKATTPEIRP